MQVFLLLGFIEDNYKMNSKKNVQHVYLVGAKSLGAYGGYETFVYNTIFPAKLQPLK